MAAQLAAQRGWMVPAYTLPPNAEHVKIMRVLVKETLGHSLTVCLGQDIAEACKALEVKGHLHPRTASASRRTPGSERVGWRRWAQPNRWRT